MTAPEREWFTEPDEAWLEERRETLTPMATALCAASCATQMGLKSIDYARREYVGTTGAPIGTGWLLMAWHAERISRASMGMFFPREETG